MAFRLSRFVPLCSAVISLLVFPKLAEPSTAPAAGVLALRNSSWPSVQVEIRLGPSSQCALYPTHAIRTLKQGEVWAVVSNDVVCWRRETSPGAQPLKWTSWQSRPVPSAGVDDVTL